MLDSEQAEDGLKKHLKNVEKHCGEEDEVENEEEVGEEDSAVKSKGKEDSGVATVDITKVKSAEGGEEEESIPVEKKKRNKHKKK